MAISQSQKPQTIKTTNPQSSRLAGFVDVTLEDASAWTTADGVKQDRGWAYADGSTLVNTSGKYNSYLARTGSLVLPNGPFRTNEVDLTTTGTGWTQAYAKGIAYTDASGEWRLRANIRGGMSSAARTGVTITVSGVTFEELQEGSSSPLGTNAVSVNQCYSTGSTFVMAHTSGTTTGYMLFFDVQLTGKPTWADANLESYPVVQLYDSIAAGALGLPEATADVSGIVTRNQVAEAGRNRVINGEMGFWQRATSDVTNPTTPTYLADRWQVERQGQSGVNFLRDTDVPNTDFKFSIRAAHQSVPASSRAGLIWQRIEVDQYRDLIGSAATISWWQKVTHTGGTSSVLVYQNTDATEDVWGSENNSETLVVNEVIARDGTAWEKKSHTFTIPANALTGIVVGFSSFIDNASTVGSIFVTGVKLEEGTVATKFTRAGGTYAGELALCQRYYEIGTAFYYGVKGTRIGTSVQFNTPKRVVNSSGIVKTTEFFSDGEITGISPGQRDTGSFYWITNSGLTVGDSVQYGFDWTADAEL